MKKEYAEELVCPFMSNCVANTTDAMECHTNCVTTDCMALVVISWNNEDKQEQGCCVRLKG